MIVNHQEHFAEPALSYLLARLVGLLEFLDCEIASHENLIWHLKLSHCVQHPDRRLLNRSFVVGLGTLEHFVSLLSSQP